MNDAIHVNEKDNLITCLRDIKKGEVVKYPGGEQKANSDIPCFHKMATEEIKKGELCYKYGEVIGEALEDIHPGDYVHVHNIESTRGRGDKIK